MMLYEILYCLARSKLPHISALPRSATSNVDYLHQGTLTSSAGGEQLILMSTEAMAPRGLFLIYIVLPVATWITQLLNLQDKLLQSKRIRPSPSSALTVLSTEAWRSSMQPGAAHGWWLRRGRTAVGSPVLKETQPTSS